MDDENRIRRFVRLNAYKGRELSDIFNYLYDEFYGEPSTIGAHDLARWFRYLRLDVDNALPRDSWCSGIIQDSQIFEGPPALKYSPSFHNGVAHIDDVPPLEFHLALKIIFDEFAKLHRTYKSRNCARNTDRYDCKMELLSERYAIDAGEGTDERPTIFLVDIYHNEKRELKINGDCSSNTLVDALTPLDPTHFFCKFNYEYAKEYLNADASMEIYLFQLDVARMECTIVDKHKLKDNLNQIFIDSVDSNKFIFIYQNESDEKYAHRGHLTDEGNLEFCDEKLSLEIQVLDRNVGMYEDSYKFVGDKFYGLCRGTDKPEFIIFEAIFKKGKAHILKLVNFGVDTTYGSEFEKYVWFDSACYVFMDRGSWGELLYKFDLDTQKVIKTEPPIYDVPCCALAKNGVITVGTLSYESQHAWHRFPSSQPATLLHLSMERLQQEAIFMDDAEKAKFIQKLPPNLRSFGQSSSLESDADQPECSTNREQSELKNFGTKRQKLEN